MGFINIAEQLYEILQTVKAASGSKLAQCFSYDVTGAEDATWYPYACVVQQGAIEDPLDSANNKALYTFLIRAAAVPTDKAQCESDMRGLADDILAELRKRGHATFGSVADRVFPFKTTWKWINSGDVQMRVFEIEIIIQQSHFIW